MRTDSHRKLSYFYSSRIHLPTHSLGSNFRNKKKVRMPLSSSVQESLVRVCFECQLEIELELKQDADHGRTAAAICSWLSARVGLSFIHRPSIDPTTLAAQSHISQVHSQLQSIHSEGRKIHFHSLSINSQILLGRAHKQNSVDLIEYVSRTPRRASPRTLPRLSGSSSHSRTVSRAILAALLAG